MKILVTGAAGFIGFHTCLKLVKQGHEVYGIDNINDYYDPKLKFDRLNELGFNEAESKLFKNEVQSSKFNSLRFFRIDLFDYESIDILFRKEQFEVVCNLAAQAGVRYSIENPKAYIDSNISGFLNILEACRNHKVKHLVYASSSSVYGDVNSIPINEKNSRNPINPYGETKVKKENLASKFWKDNSKVVGLRYFNVYGKGQTGSYAGVITQFLRCINEKTSLLIHGNGNQIRDFISVEDIAKANLTVMQSNVNEGFFNVGTSIPTSIFDLANIMIKISKLDLKLIFDKEQPGDIGKSLADTLLFIKKTGWKYEINLNDGLKKLINDF